jgi:hypothetical protein
MPKAGFIVARVSFCVLAASMLGVAMLAVPTAAWASSGGCTKSSPCSLAFTTDGQPAGTTVNTTITPSFDSPAAGPVKVEVLDALGQLVTNVKAAVTVAITSTANPGSGTLAGTTTVNTSGGVASFSNLSINRPGFGYTLTATSSGMNAATSADFNIWGLLKQCSTTPCSASQASATTTGTVSTSSATDQFLGVGVGGVSYSCSGTYQPVSDPVGFEVLRADGAGLSAQFSVTFRIDKSPVQSSGHPGASSWQICYASPVPFKAQPGTPGTAMIGGVGFDTGLLLDCSSSQGAPCVQARNKDNAGDVIVTFLALGDPFGHT